MMRDTGAQLTQQVMPAQQERYPILGNTTLRHVPDEDQLPVSRYSAQYKIPRKEVSSPDAQKQSNVQIEPTKQKIPDGKEDTMAKKSIDDPFRDGIYNTDLTTSPPKTSTSATAAESTAQESKFPTEPRQTRTSVLRARLSAGQIVKNGQSNPLIDLIVPDKTVPGAGRRDSLRARNEDRARRSITPPVTKSLQARASRESISGNRAPAKFVGGSRRPSHTHRPGSRGSFRDEARAPSPPRSSLPPSRAAPTRPVSQDGASYAGRKDTNPTIKQRTSSIPVSRNTTPTMIDERSGNASQIHYATAKPVEIRKFSPTKQPRNESSIYNDHSSQDLMKDLETTPPPRSTVNRLVPFLIDNSETHALEAIQESPQRSYQTKRLSSTSPEFGPTLKISPSAERFIMGSAGGESNRSASKNSSNGSKRVQTKDGFKPGKSDTSPISSAERLPERPSSSQGLSRLGSRLGLMDSASREKKVKSADLGIISPNAFDQAGVKLTEQPQDADQNRASFRGSGTSSGTAPVFFDASEESQLSSHTATTPNVSEETKQNNLSEEHWITPLMNKASTDAPSSHERSPVALQTDAPNDVLNNAIVTKEPNPFRDSSIVAQDFAEQSQDQIKKVDIEKLYSTPQGSFGKSNIHSISHPPRSSSRMSPADWTSSKKSPSPPVTAEKIPPPTPPKPKNREDFSNRQNNLGTRNGHKTSQIDLKSPSQPKHDSLRVETPRNSYRSQASSLPKGNSVLSNLKGLFHKRSENVPLKPANDRKATKPRVNVTRNGSPYPPISEIRPIYRPTLASTSRAKASTPILRGPTTAGATTNATPATPSYASPLPTDVSVTTAMAMQILNAARSEQSSPKKERLLKLGEVMCQAITQARDAEKAMEEAKQAARKAEVAHVLCQKSLGDVNRCVREWRGKGDSDGDL